MPAAAVALGFPVGERTEYREKYGAVHPYKIHSSIQLKKIPTLIEWETTTGSSSLVVKKQLVEGQCYNQECLNEFFNS